MSLEDVKVPLYDSSGEDKEHKLIINEFAGRIQLTIKEGETEEINVECYFEDLERAWNAVKKH